MGTESPHLDAVAPQMGRSRLDQEDTDCFLITGSTGGSTRRSGEG